MRILDHHRQQGFCGPRRMRGGGRDRAAGFGGRGGSRTSCRPARMRFSPGYGKLGVGLQRRCRKGRMCGIHQGFKAAALGIRRPHPEVAPNP